MPGHSRRPKPGPVVEISNHEQVFNAGACIFPPGPEDTMENEDARYQSLLHGALEAVSEVNFAVLYGSVARGTERPDSDIDLGVALLNRKPAVRSLRLGEAHLPNEQPRAEASENPEVLFGIWRERDVTLAGIRERAWHRR